jgi:heme-degrading monooxygenase HmoA
MIERHVTFNVLPSMGPAFEKLFVEEYRPAMSQMLGFVKVELLRSHENTSAYMMTIRFESLDTAAAWRNSAAHQDLKPRIAALYDGSTVQVFDVVA